MRKIYSLVLIAAALLVGTNVWADPTEIVVNDFNALKTALSTSGTADIVKFGQDIQCPNTTELLNIQRSLTLDGQGYELKGYCSACNVGAANPRVALAVNHGGNKSDALDVIIKNFKLVYNESTRLNGIATFAGIHSLTLDNVNVGVADPRSKNGYNLVALLIAGTEENPDMMNLTIKDTYFSGCWENAYPIYCLKPINAKLTNTTIEGFCAIYFKYQATGTYGITAGSRGSVVEADACSFICKNGSNAPSNNFCVFPMEDDGITLKLHNCSYNAETLGTAGQRLLNLQYQKRLNGETDYQDCNLIITGDNTHIYNITDVNKVMWNGFAIGKLGPSSDEGVADDNASNSQIKSRANLNVTISGGTFSFNPEEVRWYTYDNGITVTSSNQGNYNTVRPDDLNADENIESDQYHKLGRITLDNDCEVNAVSQGGTTVYRVVKKAAVNPETSTLYDLNDAVETATEGENPVTSFELSTGGDMTLNNEVTTAGYVQVKDNGTDGTTVTVGQTTSGDDQTLVINNGLDVQGNSQVIVEPGATLQIGEGGIVTSKPENIVIEADENGAASLLMDPTITVNQTPELTVRMLAKQIGKNAQGDYYWHRFAMPVEHIATWTKQGGLDPAVANNYPTYLYGWDYANNDWLKLTNGVSDMVPLLGYTLTLASDEIGSGINTLQDVTYIFKGNLVGNTNQPLNFQAEGFNFFGNSYTGYIDVLTLIEGFVSNNVEGTVYMWCNDPTNEDGNYQSYVGVPLYKLQNPTQRARLADWQKEVAPMQTFILRLRGADSANEEVDYASTIWGNPRYGNSTPTSAPARVAAVNSEEAFMEIVVKAADGKGSRVDFTQDANHSDAFESGYDVVKYMNEHTINLYASINGEDFSSVVTNTLNGKLLSLQTNDDVNYTMSFKNVEGTEYAILDHTTNQMTVIAEGNTYQFAAQPNSTIEGRFEIVSINRMPTAIENTEVKASAKGIYTITGQYVGENFEILPAGVYVVDGVKIVK